MARKKKTKKIKLHPVTSFIILIGATIILSAILSLFNVSASYDSVNLDTNELEQTSSGQSSNKQYYDDHISPFPRTSLGKPLLNEK